MGVQDEPRGLLGQIHDDPFYTLAMDAMNRVLASMSPDDTAAALRLLRVLEECRQMSSAEAAEWRRRLTG